MAKMTFKKAAEIIDRIIDEDFHVYTDDAINALELGKEALLWIDDLITKAENNVVCDVQFIHIGGHNGQYDE